MQDNCISHKFLLATGRLEEHSLDFSVINRLPKNPDLNLTAHLWIVLEQDVNVHHPAPTNLTELWTALVNIWQVIPLERFQKLVGSMLRQLLSKPEKAQLVTSFGYGNHGTICRASDSRAVDRQLEHGYGRVA
ncbi:transposable element Tcb2 transposase [Trichonephila clavipes]|nr:transposable element Tcb2 transposase [Trichonephila clavipes]